MSVSSGPRIAKEAIQLLIDQIAKTTEIENPRDARITLDTLGRYSKQVIRIFKDRPGLEDVQDMLDTLVETGTKASNQVQYICPECDETHRDSKSLCRSCQNETEWQDEAKAEDQTDNPADSELPEEDPMPADHQPDEPDTDHS